VKLEEQVGYFHASDRGLYGASHAPDTCPPRAAALFLAPFGEERKCACRLLLRTARACAGAGVAAFRFDLSGVGESTGDHGAATLRQWLEDAGAALDLVNETFAGAPWVAVGARLGANLAARLAASRGASRLVLIEPLLSGGDYVRDLLRRQQIKTVMTGAETGRDTADAAAQWAAGKCADLGGFGVSPTLAAELEGLSLCDDLSAVPEECVIHLLRVSGGKKFPPAWQPVLDRIGRSSASDAAILHDKPFWGQLEYYESDVIPAAVVGRLSDAPALPPLDESGQCSAVRSRLEETIELRKRIAERAVRFAVDGRSLVGNLAAPADASGPGVVFVHGWSGNRSGPHNLLTTMARKLADSGIPSLRFDFRGRGESEGEGMETTLPSMAADLEAAVRLLTDSCGVRKVVLFGMCSGGNVAIGTLPRIPSAAGLILLSVYPFSDGDAFSRDIHRTWHYAREYGRKALRGDTWGRLVRGEIHLRQVLNVLFGHFLGKKKKREREAETGRKTEISGKTAKPTTVESRSQDRAPPKKHLANLTKATPALMVYGSADPDAKAARRYYGDYAEQHGLPIRFVDIGGANHNFSSVAWKEELAGLAVDFCRSLGEA